MVIALNEVADQSFWPRPDHPGRRRRGHHRRGVRRRRADREDGRRRPEPGAALVDVRPEDRPRPGRRDAQGAGGAVDHRHRRDAVGRRAHPAQRDRRRSAGTPRTTWCTTPRSTFTTPSRVSAACWPGWSTPRRRRSSAWSSAPSSWRSCTCCRSAAERSRPKSTDRASGGTEISTSEVEARRSDPLSYSGCEKSRKFRFDSLIRLTEAWRYPNSRRRAMKFSLPCSTGVRTTDRAEGRSDWTGSTSTVTEADEVRANIAAVAYAARRCPQRGGR